MTTPESLWDDLSRIRRAKTLIERTRKLIARECDRSPLGSAANDLLESARHELEERAASLGYAMDELQDEINAVGLRETAADVKWHQARVA